MTTPAQSERTRIRREKRAARRGLSADARANAEAAIVGSIRALTSYHKAHRVGSYAAFDGEPDIAALMSPFGDRSFYLPVISRDRMTFAPHSAGSPTRRNGLGITEPTSREFVSVSMLDLVLTPLVAFDANGTRLGVGGGYYDRCFSFLRHRRRWLRPRLLGVAFDCQRVETLTREAWDVPLWAVATERGIRFFDRGNTLPANPHRF